MEAAALPPPLADPDINTTNTMLSFDNPRPSNPFSSPYDHPYSSLADFDESDYEPLLPARNPFRDPSLSSTNLSSNSQTPQTPTPNPTPNPASNANLKTTSSKATTNFRTAKHTHLYSNPPAPIQRYTDESIIPAIITNVIPSAATLAKTKSSSSSLSSRPSFLRKLSLKGGLTTSESRKRDGNGLDGKKTEEQGILKVMYMPRSDYQKYFARGVRGEYVGTEPYRRWREEELEERFGKFKPVYPIGRGRGRGRGRW